MLSAPKQLARFMGLACPDYWMKRASCFGALSMTF